ncbi:MAG: cobalamin B12-binding domain-containing protein [Candidatus Liptonbacteria bacterium]|nr:cobalamin B12-binding domain-containing protein [Candidatus Liptonbacteria bacterium]
MGRNMDVLLIAPGDRIEIYQALGKSQSALETPVWAGLLATFLRKKGYSVHIIDANAEGLEANEVARRAAEVNAVLNVIVCYGHQPNASTQVMPHAGRIVRAIKEENSSRKVIMVGGHVAALPEQTLREEMADFVCTGEGPYTLSALTEALKNNATDYKEVPGVIYREDGGVIRTKPAKNVTKLDEEMPGMAYDLLPMHLYRAHGWHCYGHDDKREPYASLYTTLGCPFHCTFCPIQAPFKEGESALGYKPSLNSYRRWSAKTIGDQLELLAKNYGIYNVKFADEMFVYHKRHVLELCNDIIGRGLDLNTWAYVRIDTAGDDEQLELLRKAGVRWLCPGIESGDTKVRDDVDKSFAQESIFTTIERIRKHGIYVIGNYLFGLPEDDLNSMQKTLTLAMELNCEHANFYSAMAYPGSQLYRYALEKQWPLPKSWGGFSQHSVDSAPLPTNHLTGAQVLEFRDWAWTTYFTNPNYLAMVERTFGKNTADKIRKKATVKLVRNNVPVK